MLLLVGLPLAGLVVAARDIGWLHFRIPERKLQTERTWFHHFGVIAAAAMWGIHVGLGFATRITFMGFWLLSAAVVLVGSGSLGAFVFLGYWVGRALPLWLLPLLDMRGDQGIGVAAMDQALGARYLFERVRCIASICLVAAMLKAGLQSPIIR